MPLLTKCRSRTRRDTSTPGCFSASKEQRRETATQKGANQQYREDTENETSGKGNEQSSGNFPRAVIVPETGEPRPKEP